MSRMAAKEGDLSGQRNQKPFLQSSGVNIMPAISNRWGIGGQRAREVFDLARIAGIAAE